MKVRSLRRGLAVLALVAALPALAIEAEEVADVTGFDQEEMRVGADLRVGVGSFTGGLGDLTGAGGILGVTATARPWRVLGLEGGFEGQRIPISDNRVVQDDQSVWRWNMNLLLKGGPRFLEDKLFPFVGTGVGLTYLNPTDGAEPLYSWDFLVEWPFAAGLEYGLTQNISAGARATWSWLLGEDMVNQPGTLDTAQGGVLNFALTVGGRF